ncbi:hypothetical protein GQ44DRAFT_733732 [Phaeosphaeriaceae sp. PMI808]|nr:hypothetical protein GQ44DRAFT_733732 [Phaeosphaeriaceae sp. PMI808]
MRGPNVPEYTVEPGDMITLEARLPTNRVLLIDFGAAFYYHERPTQIFTPAPYASPEILFQGGLTPAVDKWAFGCLLYEFCSDRSFIKLLFGCNNDAIKDQVAMLGKPPDTLWKNWTNRHKYFEGGTSKESESRRLKVEPPSLLQRVRIVKKPVRDRRVDTDADKPLEQDLSDLYDLLKEVMLYDAQ